MKNNPRKTERLFNTIDAIIASKTSAFFYNCQKSEHDKTT